VLLWRPVSSVLLDQSESIDGIGPLRVAIDAFPPTDPLDYEPHFAGASGALRSSHAVDGLPVEVHAFHYVRQHETGEMVHGGNYVVRTIDFQSHVLSTQLRQLPWGTVASYRIRREG